MNEAEKKVQEMTAEIARLRGRLVEAIAKACFNCEEYIGHDDKRCAHCSIHKMKELD
jgi:hypothetical protein